MLNHNGFAPTGAAAAGQLRGLIEELGAWRVLAAALAALVRRQKRPCDRLGLNNYLRRDIGLPPSAAPPVGRGQFW
ncbi:hypothetical protein [Phaeovulum sp.]|uniref:hypothetical protein n=1 Tax=Phaeovulum sp. TaxID=2934796 RepID=UPI0035617699